MKTIEEKIKEIRDQRNAYILAAYDTGKPVKDIAGRYKLSVPAIYKILRIERKRALVPAPMVDGNMPIVPAESPLGEHEGAE